MHSQNSHEKIFMFKGWFALSYLSNHVFKIDVGNKSKEGLLNYVIIIFFYTSS